jgi:hypothetical protein
MRKELHDRCRAGGFQPEWLDVLRDLDRLQQGRIEQGGKSYLVRTEATGVVPGLLKAVGLALPPRVTAAGTAHRPTRRRHPSPRKRCIA